MIDSIMSRKTCYWSDRRGRLISSLGLFGSVVLVICFTTNAPSADRPAIVLKKGHSHLRSGTVAEWDEFKERIPDGTNLQVRFLASRNATEQTLLVEQDDVKFDWPVTLNGTNLGKLFLMEAPLVWTIPVPPGTLREGENVLMIKPPRENDDIIVGPISLDSRNRAGALGESELEVAVSENDAPVPSRITITRSDGVLPSFTAEPLEGRVPSDGDGFNIAVRPGVIYMATGRVRIHLPSGKYWVYGSRGPEYSVARKKIVVRRGQTARVNLLLKREVPMPGFVSCDTHVHTWTYSRHGDASLDERMLTIAGEALELPIATDHNVIVDYAACAKSNGLARYFTPVAGDEVTTAKGHFNAFPMRPDAPVPDAKLEHWPNLMEAIRATPGVQIVILNHPADTHTGFCPFEATNFNRVTGENLRSARLKRPRPEGPEFTFDGLELINSGALRTDLMEPIRGWFALLNYGYKITGIGASDSHDVSRFIVGQGRTYIECDDGDPARINVDTACRNLRSGKALVSLGLIANMHVENRFAVGDLATALPPEITVTVDVLGPSWMAADRVELFANGVKIREKRIGVTKKIEKTQISWKMPRPLHDCYLVAIASGPGVTEAYWAIPRPYQPTSTQWTPRLLGVTNPIWVDADGDGRFTPAREYARQIVESVGTAPSNLIAALSSFDESVAAQAAGLCQSKGADIRSDEFQKALRHGPAAVRIGFAAYAATLGPGVPRE